MKIVCPYCNRDAVLVDDAEVYGTSYGSKMWLCRPCDAYVKANRGTESPNGILAKRALRGVRKSIYETLNNIRSANAKSYRELMLYIKTAIPGFTGIQFLKDKEALEVLHAVNDKAKLIGIKRSFDNVEFSKTIKGVIEFN